MDMDQREILTGAYRDFNARRMDAVLARMTPDVFWPNGWEGGYVHGHEGVRDYWTRQWAVLDPHVEPMNITEDGEGRWVVEVHQVVRGRAGDQAGQVLADTMVRHVYRLRDGLIERMDIE
jgi:ketosteroid isomerase-like protein